MITNASYLLNRNVSEDVENISYFATGEVLNRDDFGFGFDLSDLELPWRAQIALVTIYTLTILFAVVGNLLVLTVLIGTKRRRTEINVFLMNLALADLCMACFCIPFSFTRTMLGRWIFGQFMCPLVLFMQVLSVTVSIYTNMAIGIERFRGIVYPMSEKLTKSRARMITLCIWVFAMTVASAQLFVSRSNQQQYRGVRFWDCNERWSTRLRQVYSAVIACITYFLPLSVLAAVYSRIGSLLWSRKPPGNADDARDRILLRSKQKVIKLLFTIVVVFAICWFPLHTFNLVLDFTPQILDYIKTTTVNHIFVGVYYTCHWMAMANSFTNPIIFCFLNDNFKSKLRVWIQAMSNVDTVSQCPGHAGRSSEANLHHSVKYVGHRQYRTADVSISSCRKPAGYQPQGTRV